MKYRRNNTDILNKSVSTAYILYTLVIFAGSFWCMPRTQYWWMVLLIGISGGFIGIGALYLYNRQIKRFLDNVNFCMDEMLNMPDQITFPDSPSPETIMARFQSKLERLYLLIKETEERTRRENEKLHMLISDISHQTKTPMTNLKMYLSILKDDTLPAKDRREFSEETVAQAEKLEFLIDSLIKLSRLETGVFQLICKPGSLYQTLADAMGGILLAAEEKHLNVKVVCPEDLIINHDRKWTEEALFNLLENAVKYTPKNGKIEVQVNRWESHVKIDIMDSGIGIPEHLQSKVFQRFYRAPAAADYKGAGIGLYITRQILERQHGFISVSSSEGKGSTFSVFLPV